MPWWLASSSPLPSRVFFYGIPTWLLLLASCICIFIHDTPGVLALASVFIGWLVGRLALTTYLIMIYISRHCLKKKGSSILSSLHRQSGWKELTYRTFCLVAGYRRSFPRDSNPCSSFLEFNLKQLLKILLRPSILASLGAGLPCCGWSSSCS